MEAEQTWRLQVCWPSGILCLPPPFVACEFSRGMSPVREMSFLSTRRGVEFERGAGGGK